MFQVLYINPYHPEEAPIRLAADAFRQGKLVAFPVQPHSMVYNSIIEVTDKMLGFDSMRRRKSPLNEGFLGNPGDSYSVW